MSAKQAKQAEKVWQELQADLAKMSSDSQILVAEKSGHSIQVDQPILVADAIHQMVNTVRGLSPSV
jgi:pimeloyl-ACP methyl ester carboxylesterase